jgi:Bacterial archaeo-eukaryotic release factor family 3
LISRLSLYARSIANSGPDPGCGIGRIRARIFLEDIMIETKSEAKLAAESWAKEIVPELIHAAGPCITLLFPPYRPGQPGESAAAVLKTDLQEAARKLAARRVAEPLINELLEPLRQLSHEEASLAGSGSAHVIFRSQGVFRQFELRVPPSPARGCTVGNCFWVRPMLASLALPADIYVLEVTKKSVKLLACGLTEVARVGLPKGTPDTLEEALEFKAPDHDLINRSAAGPSTGAMHGVQFGTGSGRETQHAHLHDFYRAIDRGVNELLRSSDALLILAGVDVDVAIYRSISTYAHLLAEGIHGSPGAAITPAQILRRAHEIALFDVQRQAGLELAECQERLAPGRFSSALENILPASAEGRVSVLYLDENGQRMGNFDGKPYGGSAYWHDEDLLNVAAVETLRHGGAVHALPSHLMNGPVAAAALRY